MQEQGEAGPGPLENCSSSLGSTEQGNATDSRFLVNGIATRLKKGEVEPCRGCLNTFSPPFLIPQLLWLILGSVSGDSLISISCQAFCNGGHFRMALIPREPQQ